MITIVAVAIGLAGLIFLGGYRDGAIDQMRSNIIRLYTGHIQIHCPGFTKKVSPELTIPQADLIRTRLNSDADVKAFSERMKCQALVCTDASSRGVLLIGIDPTKEKTVTDIQKHITSGAYLSENTSKPLPELIIGDGLAKKLNLKVGDKPSVLSRGIDGTTVGQVYRVQGICHTGSLQVDELVAYVPLASAQNLLDLPGQTHEFVVALKTPDAMSRSLTSLRSSLGGHKLEIAPWYEILPEPLMWIKWYQFMLQTMIMTVTIIIAIGIMNTILTSVFERTKEFGVMLAVGTSPARIQQLVLLETLVLTVLGIALGTLVGCCFTFYFSQVGIQFQGLEKALAQSYLSPTIYTMIAPLNVFESIITLLVITIAISIYPAIKAGKLEPVQAIYYS